MYGEKLGKVWVQIFAINRLNICTKCASLQLHLSSLWSKSIDFQQYYTMDGKV